ncbi:MAG TPA: ATP-binding cassette domain-containing protein [Chryseolinea sp.]|nr:ATP-binding cassette domain-containing protein [Chryseolinea sp.]
MNFLEIIRLKSKLFYLFLVILGLVSSLTNIGILLLINMTLGGEVIPILYEYKAIAFILLLTLSYFTTRFFQNYIVSITNDILFDLELSIVEKVRNSSFESFEKLGVEKIYAAISDARVLSRIPEIFVTLVNSFVTIVCALGYLYWVSSTGATIILIVMANLLLIYYARNEKLEKDLNQVRDLQNLYYRSLQELLLGFKQIRISALRSNNLFNQYILPNRNKSRDLSVHTSHQYVLNQLIGVYSWYLLFGVILFLLPLIINLSIGEIAAFITSALFMMTPIAQLISFFPFYTNSKIALQRIDNIYKELESNAARTANTSANNRMISQDFETIRFENISYQYTVGDKSSFALDSLNIQINRGEKVFIIGGNGSGKSTFINVFTGLCRPSSGKIFVNEKEVTWEEYSMFNNNMAVVYSNQHLFKQNYDDHELNEENKHFLEYRNLFNLRDVLRIEKEKTNINTKLSKGEQKRFSLLLSLLENKPILVLDEWAAEQDPVNRRYFYTQWLKRIINMDKTVIAVSHDDDFYYVADRIIKFDYGKVATDTAIVTSSI